MDKKVKCIQTAKTFYIKDKSYRIEHETDGIARVTGELNCAHTFTKSPNVNSLPYYYDYFNDIGKKLDELLKTV